MNFQIGDKVVFEKFLPIDDADAKSIVMGALLGQTGEIVDNVEWDSECPFGVRFGDSAMIFFRAEELRKV